MRPPPGRPRIIERDPIRPPQLLPGRVRVLDGTVGAGRQQPVVAAVELDPFKSVLAGIVPSNNTDGANPVINTVLDETTLEYDVITGTGLFSVAGSDLGPDTSQDDEYVALISATGVETTCMAAYSDLGNVKAQLVSPLEAGTYTLAVFTRSGLGGEYGVRKATRKVKVA